LPGVASKYNYAVCQFSFCAINGRLLLATGAYERVAWHDNN